MSNAFQNSITDDRDAVRVVELLRTEAEPAAQTRARGVAPRNATLARLAAGVVVGADEYYLRIAPSFETGSPEFGWLNRVIAVGAGYRLPTGPIYNVFEVV